MHVISPVLIFCQYTQIKSLFRRRFPGIATKVTKGQRLEGSGDTPSTKENIIEDLMGSGAKVRTAKKWAKHNDIVKATSDSTAVRAGAVR